MLLLDSIQFWIQFTEHLAHPSELTWVDWLVIITIVYNLGYLFYILLKFTNAAMNDRFRGPGGTIRWW